MKKIAFIFLIILVAFSFNRCSNEIDLYSDYKEITIVYGLLDISDDTVWVKVTRAFLGPGNALLIAQIPDSSNYSHKLPVSLTGRKNGSDLAPIVFDTITIRNKKAGDSVFYFPNQLMYYSTANLDKEATYTLKIDRNGEFITAQTPVINNFDITKPVNKISFTSPTGEIEWNSGQNARRFEANMFFNYTEWAPGYNDTLAFRVNWFLGVELSKNTDGGENMSISYSGDSFYNLLKNEIPQVPNVKRWAGNVDVVISSASQEFHTYIEVNNADGNILQEVPLYTNIENGIGIFGSRHTVSRSYGLSVQSEKDLVNMDPSLGFVLPTY